MKRTISDFDNIVNRYQKKAPVPVVRIAYDMGLKVYRVGDWTNTLSGKIVRDEEKGGKSGYAIYVNASHAETRQRFTIAHEIGHYVLHDTLIGNGISDDGLYRSGLSGLVEAQANRYAADMLMPWHLVNKALREGVDNVKDLAEQFNVSKSAMSIRLGVPYE